jgi:hypothetical protein
MPLRLYWPLLSNLPPVAAGLVWVVVIANSGLEGASWPPDHNWRILPEPTTLGQNLRGVVAMNIM